MISSRLRTELGDALLSIMCGLALLVAARALNTFVLPLLPDDLRLLTFAGWWSPLDRLAVSRLLLFIPVVAVLAPLLTWPLAQHASRRDIVIALPGAACAAVLFFLLARTNAHYPFPLWLDIGRGLLLALALLVSVLAWWRYLPARGAA